MRHWLFFFLLVCGGGVYAQTPIDWTLLSKVNYVQKMDLQTRYVIRQPRFSKSIKELDGQQVEITGYIFPLDVQGEVFALSRYPFAACFFCGGAGLESIMDIWFAKRDQDYQLDQQVKLRGILRLSDSGDGLLYLLDEAVEVK